MQRDSKVGARLVLQGSHTHAVKVCEGAQQGILITTYTRAEMGSDAKVSNAPSELTRHEWNLLELCNTSGADDST